MTPAVHAGFFSPATLGWVLLVFAVVWSLRALGRPATAPRFDWKWWLLLGGVLLCFRWPLIWLPYELHVDESLLIAGGMTLRHDPVYWRSVDCGTAGPLDVYPLLAAGFVSPPYGYAVARIMAVLLILGMLGSLGASLALVSSRATARLTVLPLLAFESFTVNPEFIHYSTELMPGFLAAAGIYAIVRQVIRPAHSNIWFASVLLGAAPFAKPQVGPIVVLLWLFLAFWEIRAGRRSNLSRLLIGGFSPALAILTAVTVAGVRDHMLLSYFMGNFAYVQRIRYSAAEILGYQLQRSVLNGYLGLWLAGSAVYFVGATAWFRNTTPLLRRLQAAAAVWLVVALFCLLAPGRKFDHYMNFITLPVCGLAGVTLAIVLHSAAGCTPSRLRILAGVFLACALFPQMALRLSPRVDPYAVYNVADRGPSYRELAQAVRAITTPGEALGLWGWRSSLYVETGLGQATRLAANQLLLEPGPWQNYFLRVYLSDIQSAHPPVFADTTGVGNFHYHDRSLGYEIYPELHTWIDAHYTYFGEVDAVRLYVRNDRLAAAKSVWPPDRRKP